MPAAKLDQFVDLVGELVTVQARLSEIAAQHDDPEIAAVSEEIERLTSSLRENSMNIRMLPIRATFEKFRRLVHDLARDLGKEVELTIEGAETELDKTVIERLNDPLVHLIRNSMDHGIEAPELRAAQGKPEVIACPVAIQPHPHGIEFGQLKRMAAASEEKLLDFLLNGFSRVGKKSAQDMCDQAGLKATLKVNGLSAEQLKALLAAMQAVAVPAPPTSQCLSPIGEELIRRGLDKEFQMDFVAARTRPSSVFSCDSFMVEAAIGYGGKLPRRGTRSSSGFRATASRSCTSRVPVQSPSVSRG